MARQIKCDKGHRGCGQKHIAMQWTNSRFLELETDPKFNEFDSHIQSQWDWLVALPEYPHLQLAFVDAIGGDGGVSFSPIAAVLHCAQVPKGVNMKGFRNWMFVFTCVWKL